jgi:hypothetical protein
MISKSDIDSPRNSITAYDLLPLFNAIDESYDNFIKANDKILKEEMDYVASHSDKAYMLMESSFQSKKVKNYKEFYNAILSYIKETNKNLNKYLSTINKDLKALAPLAKSVEDRIKQKNQQNKLSSIFKKDSYVTYKATYKEVIYDLYTSQLMYKQLMYNDRTEGASALCDLITRSIKSDEDAESIKHECIKLSKIFTGIMQLDRPIDKIMAPENVNLRIQYNKLKSYVNSIFSQVLSPSINDLERAIKSGINAKTDSDDKFKSIGSDVMKTTCDFIKLVNAVMRMYVGFVKNIANTYKSLDKSLGKEGDDQ